MPAPSGHASELLTPPLIVDTPRGQRAHGSELLQASPVASAPPTMRGFDSGTSGFVTWRIATLTPRTTDTSPNYTGTLSDVHVENP